MLVQQDDWLSKQIQTLFNLTKGKTTREDLELSLRKYENLGKLELRAYTSPYINMKKSRNSIFWCSNCFIPRGSLLLSNDPIGWCVFNNTLSRNCTGTLELWKCILTISNEDLLLCKKMKLLYPRNKKDINDIIKHNKKLGVPKSMIEREWELISKKFTYKDKSKISLNEAIRLYLVVKYNQMGVHILPEAWNSPFKWCNSFGVNALYFDASFFNHSCCPNVSRHYIGTTVVFYSMRNIEKGEPLTISYIENEYLREPLWIRHEELNFRCFCEKCTHEENFQSNSVSREAENYENIFHASKKNNPRKTLLSKDHLDILNQLSCFQRINIINDILLDNHRMRSKLIETEKQILIDILVLDYIKTKNYHSCLYWLKYNINNSVCKDESLIPLYIMYGIIQINTFKSTQYLYMAIELFKCLFGGHIKFFMKRYWADIKYIVKLMYRNFKREKKKIAIAKHLRQLSNYIRILF
ncbi:uncharacterized protein CMU_027240 [Cryptosporidium muris RN66]|uniref:SET domain-containing protein n=1 Tax=Cryptosporidium muris (strain RN66) TaxID=441375 RepID=B6ABG3_CRYMR|nr:uncharacterized protein CMU_027240 [Cryptosporidium muris RN66]EEA05715.1 hypothetical protein, conserved [Cryptosporidium muris RN66]|eukprot:XP_002140064.1 hypothetical protein [Cryptosporidium muris RN66]